MYPICSDQKSAGVRHSFLVSRGATSREETCVQGDGLNHLDSYVTHLTDWLVRDPCGAGVREIWHFGSSLAHAGRRCRDVDIALFLSAGVEPAQIQLALTTLYPDSRVERAEGYGTGPSPVSSPHFVLVSADCSEEHPVVRSIRRARRLWVRR